MKDPRIEKLAHNLLTYSIDLKENDNLLIEVLGEEGMPLAKELMRQAEQMKARPYFNIVNYELLRIMLENATEEQIKLYSKHDTARMKDMDAYIGIRASSNTSEISNIDSKIMEMYNKYYMIPVHFEERVKRTKWCILRYPNNSMAQMSKMNLENFEDFYFNVCNLDYAKMSKAMDNLKDLMNKTDKVHIVGPGTDLTFSIKGIPAEKYMGTFNIPDGEVYTAPIKNSINGFVTYNTPSVYDGFTFENIHFEFKDGKIVKATSNNTESLNKILNIDDGARYIGEFSLGVNPFVTLPMKDTLFDEKISGSFHLTPGNCYETAPNGNTSSIHWDLVCIQTKEFGGGSIYFDNTLIRKDGIFVHPELLGLNPENYK